MERDVLKILNFEKVAPTTKVFLRQEHSQCFSIIRHGKTAICFTVAAWLFVGLRTNLLGACRSFMRASEEESKVGQSPNLMFLLVIHFLLAPDSLISVLSTVSQHAVWSLELVSCRIKLVGLWVSTVLSINDCCFFYFPC